MKPWLKALGVLLAGGLLSLVVLAALLLRALAPAPGEWATRLRIGPWSRELSVPAMLRIASHPFALRWLAGRTLHTAYGPLRLQALPEPNHWLAVCAPCSVQLAELGRDALRVSRAEFTLEPDTEMNWHGRFALGDGPQALQGSWSSRIEPQHLSLSFRIADEPVAKVFRLFADEIPELARAQIDGSLSLTASWVLPARELTLSPRVEGLRVAGLGTEALLNAQACGADDIAFGTWLPRAVIAAEDQRFDRHTGFDLDEVVAAWARNQRPGESLHGASTLSQQLAKLVYTGDEPSHGRKLRELLYAVELDRTLGKARVLYLYLSLAPWGDGQCGAHAAAQHLLNKRADQLSAIEAVWLATLLHNPDRELAHLARDGVANAERMAWVADQLRPIGWHERVLLQQALKHWQPPLSARAVATAVAASAAAQGH